MNKYPIKIYKGSKCFYCKKHDQYFYTFLMRCPICAGEVTKAHKPSKEYLEWKERKRKSDLDFIQAKLEQSGQSEHKEKNAIRHIKNITRVRYSSSKTSKTIKKTIKRIRFDNEN